MVVNHPMYDFRYDMSPCNIFFFMSGFPFKFRFFLLSFIKNEILKETEESILIA